MMNIKFAKVFDIAMIVMIYILLTMLIMVGLVYSLMVQAYAGAIICGIFQIGLTEFSVSELKETISIKVES